jgi:hypothetical protein
MVAIIGVLCFAVFVFAVLAIVMLAAEYDAEFDREPDAHAQLAGDMHLAKVTRMAEAMKADREAAIKRMAE